MSALSTLVFTLFLLWVLVATNPSNGTISFRNFIEELESSRTAPQTVCQQGNYRRICVESRRAFPELNAILNFIFTPHRTFVSNYDPLLDIEYESVDFAIFTIIAPLETENFDRSPSAFIGILGHWLPIPSPSHLAGTFELRQLTRFLRRQVAKAKRVTFSDQINGLESFRERILPDRPWEWLVALFVVVGAFWLMFPEKSHNHLTLTWQNVRHRRNWWCMVFFHLSHGGSMLRLCRTIICVNYIAPILVSRRIVTLSGLYGVVLTAAATSTALGVLVLVRRYVFGSREAETRAPIEINGGGACVYALLVAACLSPSGYDSFPGGARPFELLMANIAFDSFFLAGQKRIADYIAHTGAALGSWLFCSINQVG